MTNHDAIVIGAGMYGATIAKALRDQESMDVLVIDDNRPHAGTVPGGFLIMPTRIGGAITGSKAQHAEALALLGELWGIETIPFRTYPGDGRRAVHLMEGKGVLLERERARRGKAIEVVSGEVTCDMGTEPDGSRRFETFTAPRIIVAAGYWCQELVKTSAQIRGKMGVCHTTDAGWMREPTIEAWAPFRHLFGYSKSYTWLEDGHTKSHRTWGPEDTSLSRRRCHEFLCRRGRMSGGAGALQAHHGIRPVVRGARPCILEEREDGIILVTGGGRSGAIGAGWAAREILRRL